MQHDLGASDIDDWSHGFIFTAFIITFLVLLWVVQERDILREKLNRAENYGQNIRK